MQPTLAIVIPLVAAIWTGTYAPRFEAQIEAQIEAQTQTRVALSAIQNIAGATCDSRMPAADEAQDSCCYPTKKACCKSLRKKTLSSK